MLRLYRATSRATRQSASHASGSLRPFVTRESTVKHNNTTGAGASGGAGGAHQSTGGTLLGAVGGGPAHTPLSRRQSTMTSPATANAMASRLLSTVVAQRSQPLMHTHDLALWATPTNTPLTITPLSTHALNTPVRARSRAASVTGFTDAGDDVMLADGGAAELLPLAADPLHVMRTAAQLPPPPLFAAVPNVEAARALLPPAQSPPHVEPADGSSPRALSPVLAHDTLALRDAASAPAPVMATVMPTAPLVRVFPVSALAATNWSNASAAAYGVHEFRRCTVCVSGTAHRVGTLTSEQMGRFPFVDALGRAHSHDPNAYTATYECESCARVHSAPYPPERCPVDECEFNARARPLPPSPARPPSIGVAASALLASAVNTPDAPCDGCGQSGTALLRRDHPRVMRFQPFVDAATGLDHAHSWALFDAAYHCRACGTRSHTIGATARAACTGSAAADCDWNPPHVRTRLTAVLRAQSVDAVSEGVAKWFAHVLKALWDNSTVYAAVAAAPLLRYLSQLLTGASGAASAAPPVAFAM